MSIQIGDSVEYEVVRSEHKYGNPYAVNIIKIGTKESGTITALNTTQGYIKSHKSSKSFGFMTKDASSSLQVCGLILITVNLG